MDISPIFFYFFAGIAIACALATILMKNPVSAAFNLVLVFFSFAGIYALMNAHLIAALQILVYTGAIMVLFIFVIMLLNAGVPSFDMQGKGGVAKAVFQGAAAMVLAVLFIWVFKNSILPQAKGVFSLDAIEAAGGNTRVISELMFSEYILPFELTSILLLGCIVGAVAIAMRKGKDPSTSDRRRSV